QPLDRISQVDRGPDARDSARAVQIALADPGVDDRRFPARIGTDQQDRVGLLDTTHARIEDVAAAWPGLELAAVLAAVDIRRPARGHEVFERHHPLGVALVPRDRRDLGAVESLQLGRDRFEGLVPRRLDELAALTHVRPVETLVAQTVDRMA